MMSPYYTFLTWGHVPYNRNIKFDIPEDIDDENFNADGGRGSVEVAPTPPPAVDYSKEYTPIERVEIFEAGGVSAFFMVSR